MGYNAWLMDSSLPHWVRTPNGVAFQEIPHQPPGPLPDFMIIGAAKAGTTALHQYLSAHPQLYLCPLKEPHFFSTDVMYQRGLDWYRGLYTEAQPGQRCGEASTSYTFYPRTPQTPQRIYAVVPQVKLIYLVREPVARIQSDCWQILKYQRYVLHDATPYRPETLLALGDDPQNPLGLPNFIQTSEYLTQLERYLQYFDRQQILVVLQEELAQFPQQTLQQICRFLEVDETAIAGINVHQRANESASLIQGLKDEALAQQWGVLPGYHQWKQWIPFGVKEGLKRLNRRLTGDRQVLPPLEAATRQRLKRHFYPHNRALETFLNRDLSSWDGD